MDEKVTENRLRRQLDRMGFRLTKSRTRDERAIGYGGYMVIDKWNNFVLAGAHPYEYCMTFDDVEAFAKAEKPNLPKAKGGRK